MFKLHIPGQEIPVFRYYSFSDSFNPEYYRVSVKKELPPANSLGAPGGLASHYLYDIVNEGDILEAKGPSGDFYLIAEDSKPVVLIAGGIGITPLLAMLKSVSESNPGRLVYLFYGVNDNSDHSFQTELQHIEENYKNAFITNFYNKVGPGDVQGTHYHYEGFIKVEVILQAIEQIHLDYYICGPGPMMDYVTAELEKLGIDTNNIHVESFSSSNGPSQEEIEHELLAKDENQPGEQEFTIEFLQSGKKLVWDKRYRSILEFAEGNDIEILSGCLFGDCGTCLTDIKEGTVHYTHEIMVSFGKGECLPCSCIPTSNIVLKA